MGFSKLFNFGDLITALKSTWMKRLIRTDTKWMRLFELIWKIKIPEIWRKDTYNNIVYVKILRILSGKRCFAGVITVFY